MSEKHAPWCARYMPCTCQAPGGPNTSAAERLAWVLQRYEEGSRVLESTVARMRELESALAASGSEIERMRAEAEKMIVILEDEDVPECPASPRIRAALARLLGREVGK